MKTTVLLDHEPVADGGFLVHALLRIEGDPPATDGRVPLNLSLVLDRSGSMHGAKLAAARKAAAMLVRRLATEDTVSVVAYDDEVDVVAAPATGEAQEDLPARIGAIRSGGMTNMSGGWLLGRDLVAKALREGGVNRVLLLTDGLANVGITDPDQLVGLTRTGAEAGFSTTTIGFGKDFDEDLLRALADAGRGGSYYLEEIDQASGIFEEELEGLLSLAAQNVRVAVLPGADADFVKVLHDYPSTAEGDT
ncbi:MAG: VWA domain-containing protein, partial [Gemmatimonadota bacterium]